MSDAVTIAPGIHQLDTLLGGMDQLTAGFLVDGVNRHVVLAARDCGILARHRVLVSAGVNSVRVGDDIVLAGTDEGGSATVELVIQSSGYGTVRAVCDHVIEPAADERHYGGAAGARDHVVLAATDDALLRAGVV